MSWLLRTFGLLAIIGLLAQPAAALHGGAIADCGDAGTLTVRATPNAAGFESPLFNGVLLFEEGGTLSLMIVSLDGVVAWDDAAVGVTANAVEEVTCSFELANGVDVEATGVHTGH